METVPLPADRDKVTHPCTREFLVDPPAAAPAADAEGCAAAAEDADRENEPPLAQGVPGSPVDEALPRVRGWQQCEIDAGMREAPVLQRRA